MLDFKAQSQLAEATANVMRACALATARVAGASALQGISLWSQMLSSSTARAPWLGGGAAASDACAPTGDAPTTQHATPSASATDSAFASYRSAGGHAVAQVVLP